MKRYILAFTATLFVALINPNIANTKTEYCVMDHEELQLEYRNYFGRYT